MKENRKTYILTTLLCLIPVIAGLLLLPKLPDQIVTHWDASGNPNGWSNKFTGAVVFPGLLLILNMIMPSLMKADPRYHNMNQKTLALIAWIIPIVSIFCSATTLAHGLGINVNVPFLGCMFLGILLIMIGNYLPKMTQSYTVGIKLPWTLNDEENWNKTHRISGVVWIIGGLLIIISGFFSWSGNLLPVIFAAMVLIPIAYSYLYYRKHLS